MRKLRRASRSSSLSVALRHCAVLVLAAWSLNGCIAVSKDAYQRDLGAMRQQQDWLEAQKKKLHVDLTARGQQQQACMDVANTCAREKQELGDRLDANQKKMDSLAQSCGNCGVLLANCEREQMTQQVEIARLKEKVAAAQSRSDKVQAQLDVLRDSIARIKQRLSGLIAAGKLKVAIKNGFLVIEMQSDILFDTGKGELKAEARPVLLELAAVLQQFPDRRFQVAGHTDRRGGDAINWKLSTDRALSVVQFLIETGGVAAKNLSAGGYAHYLPVADNDTPEGMRRNRRVEFLLLPDLRELLELAGVKAE